jgi:putative ABC transport system substrate-binding protein
MNYGIDLSDTYHQVGIYAAKILKGAAVADLPIEQSSRFEFVINIKTARRSVSISRPMCWRSPMM